MVEAEATEDRRATILRRLRRSFIHLKQVDRVLDRLDALLAQDCSGSEPDNLMLLGASGTGKTRLLSHFANRHPRVEHETFTEVPVLYVEVPSKCTIKKLAGMLLLSLGSPFWDKGDEVDRTIQLVTLLDACRVRLIILDEVNHLVDRGAAKSHYAVADWIKSLGTVSAKGIVLAGIERSRVLLGTNEQLGGRFSEVLALPLLSLEPARENETFEALYAFGRLLEGVDAIELTAGETPRKLIFATGGRLRPLRRLLVRAVENAFATDSPRIDPAGLERAFEEVVFPGAPKERNPFSTRFSGIPLTKPGEPYAPEILGGRAA